MMPPGIVCLLTYVLPGGNLWLDLAHTRLDCGYDYFNNNSLPLVSDPPADRR